MNFLKKSNIHIVAHESVVTFLRQNNDLVPILQQCIVDCKELYPSAELVLELFDDTELGLLIKCEPGADDIMDRFFELEERNSVVFGESCRGRFFVDLYGLHLLRGEDI